MQIIGHRGARGEAPENTLGGFAYLHNLGIRAVEFDVRQLIDGQLVVMHDDNFIRTAGTDYPLYACGQDDLAQFNQAKNFADWSQHEITPKLEQVLALFADFEHIEVEIKAVNTEAEAERLLNSLVPLLLPLKDQVTITSFDLKILQLIQQQHPNFKRGLLVEIPLGQHASHIALQYGCSRIGWKDSLVTEELIQQAKQAGLAVSVWTVNDVQRAKQLYTWQIDGLITDFPKTMLAEL